MAGKDTDSIPAEHRQATGGALKVIVLLNPNAGSSAIFRGCDPRNVISDMLATLGVQSEVRLVDRGGMRGELDRALAAEFDAVVAGGGDGTVSEAAEALAGREIPLAILPLGTLNHFAKDLGIPLDLEAALAVVAAGRVASVDVGRVNGRVFVNNSSLGIYPRAVLEREAHRHLFGLGKWAAMALAVVNVFRRFPTVTLQLDTADGPFQRTTPLVLVGNNHYRMRSPRLGTRVRIDQGQLSLYVANTQTRWGMAKLAARALLGRLEQARDFDVMRSPHFTISADRHQIRVALDGEVETLALPLEYRIWPEALRVVVPEESYRGPTEAAAIAAAQE